MLMQSTLKPTASPRYHKAGVTRCQIRKSHEIIQFEWYAQVCPADLRSAERLLQFIDVLDSNFKLISCWHFMPVGQERHGRFCFRSSRSQISCSYLAELTFTWTSLTESVHGLNPSASVSERPAPLFDPMLALHCSWHSDINLVVLQMPTHMDNLKIFNLSSDV